MMIATCKPPPGSWGIGRGARSPRPSERDVILASLGIADSEGSYLHDLMLFGFQGFVHALDRLVGDLLDIDLQPLVLVLTDRAGLLGAFQVVHGVTPHIADGHPLLLGVAAGQLGKVAAPLLR